MTHGFIPSMEEISDAIYSIYTSIPVDGTYKNTFVYNLEFPRPVLDSREARGVLISIHLFVYQPQFQTRVFLLVYILKNECKKEN